MGEHFFVLAVNAAYEGSGRILFRVAMKCQVKGVEVEQAAAALTVVKRALLESLDERLGVFPMCIMSGVTGMTFLSAPDFFVERLVSFASRRREYVFWKVAQDQAPGEQLFEQDNYRSAWIAVALQEGWIVQWD